MTMVQEHQVIAAIRRTDSVDVLLALYASSALYLELPA